MFKVIPMLNPDGVIVGNYRCSLTGRDLNRNYKSLLKDSFPAVWHTKQMIKKFVTCPPSLLSPTHLLMTSLFVLEYRKSVTL